MLGHVNRRARHGVTRGYRTRTYRSSSDAQMGLVRIWDKALPLPSPTEAWLQGLPHDMDSLINKSSERACLKPRTIGQEWTLRLGCPSVVRIAAAPDSQIGTPQGLS